MKYRLAEVKIIAKGYPSKGYAHASATKLAIESQDPDVIAIVVVDENDEILSRSLTGEAR